MEIVDQKVGPESELKVELIGTDFVIDFDYTGKQLGADLKVSAHSGLFIDALESQHPSLQPELEVLRKLLGLIPA